MKGNAKILEQLNHALRDELTAINQYFLHAEMAENWGYKKYSKYIKKQSIDEMKHAEILIEPFRDEPEIDTLKRRFERDIDLSVLNLQLDQLQSNRALIHGYKAQRVQAYANAGRLQEAGIG